MSHHMDKISKLEIVTTKLHREGEVSDPVFGASTTKYMLKC